jgi:hypothetical protein
MRAIPRLPRVLLLVGGVVLLGAGIAGVAAGATIPDRLHALLPAVVVDAAAIGGATVALGVLLVFAGLLQVVVGLLLGHDDPTRAAGVVVLALLGTLLLAVGVALLTEVGAGASAWLLAPGLALGGVAVLYGVAAWRLAGWHSEPPDGIEGPG